MTKVDTVTDRAMATVGTDTRVVMPIPSRGMDRVTATMAILRITMKGMIGAITIGTTVMAVGLRTKADSMADMLNSRIVADLGMAAVDSRMTADMVAGMQSRTQADMKTATIMAS